MVTCRIQITGVAMYKNPMVMGAVAATLLMASIVGWAQLRFGSLANAMAYLGGRAVSVDHSIHNLGSVKSDKEFKVTFNVTNLEREPLKVVGAHASCSCVLPPEMPMTLQPFESTPLTFSFTSPSTPQQFEQEIELYFDGPLPAMPLKISGVTQ